MSKVKYCISAIINQPLRATKNGDYKIDITISLT